MQIGHGGREEALGRPFLGTIIQSDFLGGLNFAKGRKWVQYVTGFFFLEQREV